MPDGRADNVKLLKQAGTATGACCGSTGFPSPKPEASSTKPGDEAFSRRRPHRVRAGGALTDQGEKGAQNVALLRSEVQAAT